MIESKQPHYTTPQSGISGHLEVFATSHLEILGHGRKTTSLMAFVSSFFIQSYFLFGNPQQHARFGLSPFPVIVAHEGSEESPMVAWTSICHVILGWLPCILWRGDNLVVVALQFHRATTHGSFLVGGWEPQPIWKICGSYNGSFPRVNKTYLKPPPSCLKLFREKVGQHYSDKPVNFIMAILGVSFIAYLLRVCFCLTS